MDDIECEECGLRFTVVWHNDAEAQQRLRANEPVIEYCPRCGSDQILPPETSDDDD